MLAACFGLPWEDQATFPNSRRRWTWGNVDASSMFFVAPALAFSSLIGSYQCLRYASLCKVACSLCHACGLPALNCLPVAALDIQGIGHVGGVFFLYLQSGLCRELFVPFVIKTNGLCRSLTCLQPTNHQLHSVHSTP